MTSDTDGSSVGPRPRTYPHSGRRYAFKTLRCVLDRDDVAAARSELCSLFEQYHVAVRTFLGLLPVRAPYRDAFRKEDMAAAKAAAPGLEPGLRSTALDKAIEMWRSFEAKGGLSYGSRTRIPCSKDARVVKGAERNGQGNILDHVAVRLQRKDLLLILDGDLLSGSIKVSVPTPGGAVKLRILGKDHQVPILRKVLRGEEGLIRCVSELLWRPSKQGKDLCLDLHIGRPMDHKAQDLLNMPAPRFVPIGVDLGVRNILVAVAPGKGGKGVLFVKGGKWRDKHRRFVRARALRKALGDDESWTASRRSEGNYVKDMAHQASRELLDLAARIADRRKGEVPVLVMEDLDFMSQGPQTKNDIRKEQAEELDAWPRTLLMDIMIEKAAWEGIPVMVVSPDGTSITCPRCGSPEAVRRKDVHRLFCPDCAYQADDDYCAAINIAKRGLQLLLRDRETAFGVRAVRMVPSTSKGSEHAAEATAARTYDHELREVMCLAKGGAADAP